MGGCLIKLGSSTSRNRNIIQGTQVTFRISDLRRLKKRGLFPIAEVNASQENSIIQSNSQMKVLKND